MTSRWCLYLISSLLVNEWGVFLLNLQSVSPGWKPSDEGSISEAAGYYWRKPGQQWFILSAYIVFCLSNVNWMKCSKPPLQVLMQLLKFLVLVHKHVRQTMSMSSDVGCFTHLCLSVISTCQRLCVCSASSVCSNICIGENRWHMSDAMSCLHRGREGDCDVSREVRVNLCLPDRDGMWPLVSIHVSRCVTGYRLSRAVSTCSVSLQLAEHSKVQVWLHITCLSEEKATFG